MATIDFNLDPSDEKPVLFAVGGVDKLGNKWREEFETTAPLPPGCLDDVLSALSFDEQGNLVGRVPSMLRFMKAALREEKIETDEDGSNPRFVPVDDIQRFMTMLRNKRLNLDYNHLTQVVRGVLEEITGRPLG